jgi:nucleotide-binding universal stress UspA family protein
MARLEILDVGSNKGKALKANAEEALHELGVDLPIEDVSDINRLLEYGISGIPALVVDGRVVLQKMVPSTKELRVVLSILLASTPPSALKLRSIVAPTDFSDIAVNALAYAKSIAAVQGAGLNLVHVHMAQAVTAGPFPVAASHEDIEWKNTQLDSFLERPVYTNGFDSGQVPMRKELLLGPVVEEIRRLSELPDTDMIVMGSSGKSNLINRLFGSVSSEIARRASCPVLLVPEEARFRGFQHIIFAGNYEPHEERVLPRLLSFARRFGSQVQYVHVNTNATEDYLVTKIPLLPVGESRQNISELTTIESGDVLEGLLRYATEQKADLIAMSTTQRSFMDALFHRSITREAVLHIQIPLLIMHPEDIREAR